MTTIAYRGGILAADTMMSYGDSAVSMPDFKLFIAGKYVVGVSGDCRMIPTIKRWFENDDCVPDLASQRQWGDSFDVLAMDVEGDLFTLFADTLYPLPCDYFAIGSGRLLAMGAMAMGATAYEAVGVASQVDVYTGLPVQSISIKQLKKSLK